ncbi:putative Ig domain-containing protein [Chlamydia suis]|nr:putative Ig domain-containing protein [Chlamydia suis]MEB2694211.1 putative Ig domain-containing protein [Chlamydia suis]
MSFTRITPTLPAGINLNSATGEVTGSPYRRVSFASLYYDCS